MRLTFLIPGLLYCFLLEAQITINTSDMPVVGDTLHEWRDTLPTGFSIGQAGANRTWDFSNLVPDTQVTTYAVAPSSTPYASSFPNANLTLTNDFNFYLYYRNTAPALKVDGFANIDPNLGVVSVNFNPIPDQHLFPVTYPGNFSGSSGFVSAKPYNQLPPNIQQQIDDAIAAIPGATVTQVRVTFTSTYKDTIDGWGTVITPIGTYDALRRKRIENSNTKIEAEVKLIFPPTPFWQEVSNTSSNTTDHTWLSKITKLPLVSLGYDTLRNVVSVTYSTKLPPVASVAGNITTEMGTPIPAVSLQVTGTDNQMITTGNDGLYHFDVPSGGSYVATPSKSNDITANNGITTLDILLIRKKILAMEELGSPYAVIAADVNDSKNITTQDILLTRAVILGMNPTFPNGRLWAFVNSDFAFADPLNPFPYESSRTYNNLAASQTNQNFIGVKLGDVNNSWDPLVAKAAAVGSLQLAVGEYTVMSGNEIIVPVKVKDFNNITGYQFTLSWDAKVLSLLEVNSKSLQGYYGENKTSEGLLTTTWYDEATKAVTLDDEASAFVLKFKAIGATGTHSAIKIGSELTVSEAYNENLDLLNITPTNGMVKVGDVSSAVSHQPSDIGLTVQPNPFTNSTNIIFTLAQDQTVTLSIYDILGKEVKRLKADYQSGEHQFEWAGDDAQGDVLSNGLYHIRMTAGGSVLSRKVVMMK